MFGTLQFCDLKFAKSANKVRYPLEMQYLVLVTMVTTYYYRLLAFHTRHSQFIFMKQKFTTIPC